MAVEVEISNQQSALVCDEASLRTIVHLVMSEEGVDQAEISIAIVDNDAIHKLNRDFLQHDYPTDVLSFGLSTPPVVPADKESSTADRSDAAAVAIDGEVVISAEMAMQTSERFGWSAIEELQLYLVHGLLHLCGYDDLTPDLRTRMRSRESAILSKLGLSVSYEERKAADLAEIWKRK